MATVNSSIRESRKFIIHWNADKYAARNAFPPFRHILFPIFVLTKISVAKQLIRRKTCSNSVDWLILWRSFANSATVSPISIVEL